MVGKNCGWVLVDGYMKGVKVEEVKRLYEGLVDGRKKVDGEVCCRGGVGYEYYNKLG